MQRGGATAWTSAYRIGGDATAMPSDNHTTEIETTQIDKNPISSDSFLTHSRRLRALVSEDCSKPYQQFFAAGPTTPEEVIRAELNSLITNISTTVSDSNKQVGRMLEVLLEELDRSVPGDPLTDSEKALYVILRVSPISLFQRGNGAERDAVSSMLADSLQHRPLNETALKLTEGILVHEWSTELDPVVYAASVRSAPTPLSDRPFDKAVGRVFMATNRSMGKKAPRSGCGEEDQKDEGEAGGSAPFGSWGEAAMGPSPYDPHTPARSRASSSVGHSSTPNHTPQLNKSEPAPTLFESFFTALSLSADAAMVLHVALRSAALGSPDPFGFVIETRTAVPYSSQAFGSSPRSPKAIHLRSIPRLQLASEFIASFDSMETTRWILQPIVEYCVVGSIYLRLKMLVDELLEEPEMARRMQGSYGVALIDGLRVALHLYSQSVTALDLRGTRRQSHHEKGGKGGGGPPVVSQRGWSVLRSASVTLAPIKEFILTLQQMFLIRLDGGWTPQDSLSQLATTAGISHLHECLARCRCGQAFPMGIPKSLSGSFMDASSRLAIGPNSISSAFLPGVLDDTAIPTVSPVVLPSPATAVAIVLREGLKPFYHLTTMWVNRSRLEDPYGEYFVEKITATDGHDEYALLTSAGRIPNFCSLQAATAILHAGTARLVLMHCGDVLIEETKSKSENSPSGTTKKDPAVRQLLISYLEALSGSDPSIGSTPSVEDPLSAWKTYFLRCEALLYGVDFGVLLEALGSDHDDEIRPAEEGDDMSVVGDQGGSVAAPSDLGSGWYGVDGTYFRAGSEEEDSVSTRFQQQRETIQDRTDAMNEFRKETARQQMLKEHEAKMARLDFKSEMTQWKMRRNRIQRERIIAFYQCKEEVGATLSAAGIPHGEGVEQETTTLGEEYYVGLVVEPLLPEHDEVPPHASINAEVDECEPILTERTKVRSLMNNLLFLSTTSEVEEEGHGSSPDISPRHHTDAFIPGSKAVITQPTSTHTPTVSSSSSANSRRSGSKRARSPGSEGTSDSTSVVPPTIPVLVPPSLTTQDIFQVFGINDEAFHELVGTRSGAAKAEAEKAIMEVFDRREEMLRNEQLQAERLLNEVRSLHVSSPARPQADGSSWALSDASSQKTRAALYNHLRTGRGVGNSGDELVGCFKPSSVGGDEEDLEELPQSITDPGAHLSTVSSYIGGYLSQKALQFLLMSTHCHGGVYTLINALNKVCLLQDGNVANSLMDVWRKELLLPSASRGGGKATLEGYSTHFNPNRAFHSFFNTFHTAIAAQPGMASDTRLTVMLGLGEDDTIPTADDAMTLLPHFTTRIPHLGMNDPLRWLLPPQTVDRYGDVFVSLVFWRSVRELLTEVWRLSMECKTFRLRPTPTPTTDATPSSKTPLGSADIQEVWLFTTHARAVLGLISDHIWFAVCAESKRLDTLLFTRDGKHYATTHTSMDALGRDINVFLEELFVGSILSPYFSRARRQARTLVRTLEDVVDALRSYVASARLPKHTDAVPTNSRSSRPTLVVTESNRNKTKAYITAKIREFLLSTEVFVNHLEGPMNSLSRQMLMGVGHPIVDGGHHITKASLRTLATLVKGLQGQVRSNAKLIDRTAHPSAK